MFLGGFWEDDYQLNIGLYAYMYKYDHFLSDLIGVYYVLQRIASCLRF